MGSEEIIMDLPKGTVTFLFTDIEGSTELLQRLQDQYATVLEEQRVILRDTFKKWQGHEVDTQGDAFFVSFPRATDALNAAMEAQRGLFEHQWPDGVVVRVRMGLHTGESWATDEGYVGMAVHRAARIAQSGHGGQVLLSETTTALVRDELPDGVRLKELGEHRLKDMRRPEQICQLVIRGLPSDFAPLKSLDALPNNLPVQLTSFLGREREIGQVKDMLNSERLVTLTGPGGAGKTRLSLQIAGELVEEFPHGVWFVELAPVASAEYLIPAMADALQFSVDTHSSKLDAKSQVFDYLGERSLLMVMDNFEHLIDDSDLLTDMLKQSPEVKLLVTSRERLNLQEEWVFEVEGMDYPQNGDDAAVEEFSALSLFVERARQADPDFALTKKEKQNVVKICQLVEGIPLGVELATAWVKVLSCKEIAEEIEKGLDFLATSMRGLPDKHRSMRAVFDHSWQLLIEEQKRGFQKLSVFRGGFERSAAEAVADINLSTLSEFVDKSLVRRNAQDRYELHELIRQYAEEKLKDIPHEEDAVRELHSRYFVKFLADRGQLLQGERLREVRDEVRADLGNVRSAVFWAVIHWPEREAREALIKLDYFLRGQGWFEAADAYKSIAQHIQAHGGGLDLDRPRRSVLLSALVHQAFYSSNLGDAEAGSLYQEYLPTLREMELGKELAIYVETLGICAIYRSDYPEASKFLEEALQLLREERDSFYINACLLWLGWVHYELGDYEQAGARFQEANQICSDEGNRLGKAFALSKLGAWADAVQMHDKAKQYHQEAHETFLSFGDEAGQAYALSRMSLSAWLSGDYEEARRLGLAGLDHFLAIGHRWGISTSFCHIGFAELGLNHRQEAQDYFYKGLERTIKFQHFATAVYALIGLASLWSGIGERTYAVEIFTLALNHPVTPAVYKDIAQHELDNLKTQLPADEFESAEERGRKGDLEAAVEAVLKRRETQVRASADEAEDSE
jgi:predicted ATPase/class 3 adenylate cyclase